MKTIKKQEDGTYRYRGLFLLVGAGDGTYWVFGQEKWMSVKQMDQMLDARSEETK